MKIAYLIFAILAATVNISAQSTNRLNVQFDAGNNNLVAPTNININKLHLTNVTSDSVLITRGKEVTTGPINTNELFMLNNISTNIALTFTNVGTELANLQTQINNIQGGGEGTILGPYTNNPVKLILDTDVGGDIDDVGDLVLAHVLADQGEIEFLATGTPVTNYFSAPTIEVINRYYNRPTLPIGVNTNGISGATGTYGEFITANFYNSVNANSNVVDSTTLYRRILANQSSNSVTMVFTGPLRNLLNLYNSSADSYSGLAGPALITNKVARIIIAAGYWPNSSAYSPTNQNNFTFEPSSAVVINSLTNSPVRVTFAGDEVGWTVTTGSTYRNKATTDPSRAAWDSYFTNLVNTTRPAWGQVALYNAVRGYTNRGSTIFNRTVGYGFVGSGGTNSFTVNAAGNQEYLSLAVSSATLSSTLDTLLMRPALNHGIESGQTNIMQRLAFKYNDTNAFVVNTNAFVIDSTNYRLQSGTPFALSVDGLWNDTSRLFLVGSNVVDSLTNFESGFRFIRPQNGSSSFGQGVDIKVGRSLAPGGGFKAHTRAIIGVQTNDNVYSDSRALFSENIYFDFDGNVRFPNQALVASGSDSMPGFGFNSETNTGFMWPGAAAFDAVVGGAKSTRFFSGGLAFENTDGIYWSSGSYGSTVDAGLYRNASNTVKIVRDISNNTGDLLGRIITSESAFIAPAATTPPYSFSGDTDTGLGTPGGNASSFYSSGVERFRIDTSGVALPSTNIIIWSTGALGAGIGPTIRAGSGTPEGVVSAEIGSIFMRTDGGSNTTIYRKESGSGNTGWVAVSNAGGGGGGTVGTMISNASGFSVGSLPFATDTTGTNFTGSSIIVNALTNLSVRGALSGHSGAFTNSLTINGVNVATVNGVANSMINTAGTAIAGSIPFAADTTKTNYSISTNLIFYSATNSHAVYDTGTAANTLPNTAIILANEATASSGNQQVSPKLVIRGQGWKTTASAASQSVEFEHFVLPVQGSTAPSGTYYIVPKINGTTNALGPTISSSGLLTSNGGITSNGALTVNSANATIPNNGSYIFSGRAAIYANSPSTAVNIMNSGLSTSFPLLNARLVQVKTADYTVTSTESNSIFDNTGTTAIRTNTLPAAATGLTYTFTVNDSDGVGIASVGDDTIQYGTSVTAAAGTITSTTVGSSITLTAINGTNWFATSITGTWAP